MSTDFTLLFLAAVRTMTAAASVAPWTRRRKARDEMSNRLGDALLKSGKVNQDQLREGLAKASTWPQGSRA